MLIIENGGIMIKIIKAYLEGVVTFDEALEKIKNSNFFNKEDYIISLNLINKLLIKNIIFEGEIDKLEERLGISENDKFRYHE